MKRLLIMMMAAVLMLSALVAGCGSQQQKRGFWNAPLGFLGLVFVNAIHDECNSVDGKEIVGEVTM